MMNRNRRRRLSPLGRARQLLLCVAAILAGALSCRDSSVAPIPPEDTSIASLALNVPSTVLLNETVLLSITARTSGGIALPPPAVTWRSNDIGIAYVSSEGVLWGFGRGVATITATTAAGLTTSASVRVNAKVKIALQYVSPANPFFGEMVILTGDSLQLVAQFVDVNGGAIDDSVAATWQSSNPAAATMSDSGVIVGVGEAFSDITATTADGTATKRVYVAAEAAGRPATLRLAHAVDGAGPITFRRNHGAPVTLAFGESVDLPIRSGTMIVSVDGFPAASDEYWMHYAAQVREGELLALYAAGGTKAWLTPAWSTSQPIPPDSGLVRFVQGFDGWNRGGLVYLRSPDEAITGLPELCYFDPGYVSDYYRRADGGFDAIVEGKFGGGIRARVQQTAERGQANTFVFTGDGPQMRLLKFRDR